MPPSELTMSFPAETRFISTARITAASLAAELDFSIDEIEALQMGANELVSVLIELAEDHELPAIDLRYIVTESTVELIGSVPVTDPATVVEFDVLARQILDSVVDSYETDGATARLVKQRVGA